MNFSRLRIFYSLRRQSGWTHLRQIIYLDNALARDFYAEMCRIEGSATSLVAMATCLVVFPTSLIVFATCLVVFATIMLIHGRAEGEVRAGEQLHWVRTRPE